MIAKERVAAGTLKYIDCEVCPHVPGVKALVLSGLAALYAQKMPVVFDRLRKSPAIAAVGVLTEDGMVDVDAVYNAFAPKFSQPVELAIPLIGNLTLDRAEIDKLYRYIREA